MLVAVMFISCVANAQFYDSADDIYFYVRAYEYDAERKQVVSGSGIFTTYKMEKTGKVKIIDETTKSDRNVRIFNFDGRKAAELDICTLVSSVKRNMQRSSSFYEEKVETTEYDLNYSSKIFRNDIPNWLTPYVPSNGTVYENSEKTYYFSSDRESLFEFCTFNMNSETYEYLLEYKRVDKSFFRVGRSRTPSGTLYE